MSLLLKALKQAEAAHADKARAGNQPGQDRREEGLELEPLSGAVDDTAPEWVEPPALLFGNSGPAPDPADAAPPFRWPQLSLVPLVALLAAIIAVGYGIYLYFALQPPATTLPPPENVVSAAVPLVAAPPLLDPMPPQAEPILPPMVSAADTPAPAPRAIPDTPAPARATAVRPSSPARAAGPRAAAATVDRNEGGSSMSPPSPAATLQFRPDTQSSLLSQAYAAYQRGALVEAQQRYTQAAARNRSVDALLGLAAIASVQNREAEAQHLYREVLENDPRNAAAQAGLLDLLGNIDSQATESRLKTLIDRDPSPQLYQTLGNLYADQQRWNDAQAAYFEAYRGAPANADYAFNLAVSLDQLRQTPAALVYYEKALAAGGVHRFERSQAEARVRQLKTVR